MQNNTKLGFRDLFFRKRFPWKPVYNVEPGSWKGQDGKPTPKAIQDNGFLLVDDLPPNLRTETIGLDIQKVNEKFLDIFFEADDEAKHHQNLYYRFQWFLIFFTFVTTLVAAVSLGGAAASNSASNAAPATPTPEATQTLDPTTSITPVNVANVDTSNTGMVILTLAGILASSFMAYFTARNNSLKPMEKWYDCRAKAEAIRRHYYLFLAHRAPYHKDDYLEMLHDQRSRFNANRPQVNPRSKQNRKDLTAEEIKAFFDLYNAQRYKAQKKFYIDRKVEYEHNLDFIARVSLQLSVIGAGIPAVLGLLRVDLQYAIIVAMLPILVTLLNSFEKIYGWKRQIAIYEGAENRLAGNEEYAPHDDSNVTQKHLEEFIREVEETLAHEMGQWGEYMQSSQTTTATR